MLPGVAAAFVGLAVAAAALRVLAVVATRGTGAPAGAARPDDVLVLLLAWVGVGLAGWLGLGSLLTLAAALPGTAGRVGADLAERITPVAARKALTLVLGATVGSLALPPSQVSSADSSPVSAGSTREPALGASVGTSALGPAFEPSGEHLRPPSAGLAEPGAAALAPGFVPTPNLQTEASAGGGERPGYLPSVPRPVLAADHSRLLAPSPRPTAGTHDVVTVHRGDTLWAVAARHLGPDAADVQVAREWPRWYAANRDVIGDDPDLLVPGQQLRPPSDLAHAPSIERAATAVERGAHR
ncbi:MAG: hypothetical protein HOQ13_12620 [Dermatophilaceae bacterium]|nr:hypothetical protein [Dermatophilaceae bacterium]